MLRTLRYRSPRAPLVAAFVVLAAVAALAFAQKTHAPAATAPHVASPARSSAEGSASSPAATASRPDVVTIPSASAVSAAAASGPAASDHAPGVAGMVVGIDPETGKLGLPSRADRAALSRAANASPALDRSEAGLTVVHRPDGSMMIDLQGRFQDYAVVRILPDGRKAESCVQGPEVDAALHGDAAPAPDPTSTPVPTPEPQHEER